MGTGKIDKEKMKELGEIQELLWKNRLKAQVLKEYFEEQKGSTDAPDFNCYSSWAGGVFIILSEIIDAAEAVDGFLSDLTIDKVEYVNDLEQKVKPI
jgi:hypothetical protein